MLRPTDDLRIERLRPLIPPAILMEQYAITEEASTTIAEGREAINRLLRDEDDRLLVVAGPCSIHDVEAARDYAKRLRAAADRFATDLLLVMRVYFEKPRTTVGWKGLINDPRLDGSFAINDGLGLARGLLLDLAKMGLPAGCEFLDTITPQFIADLVSWGAIGARTTESQVHRELASGLEQVTGFMYVFDRATGIPVWPIEERPVPQSTVPGEVTAKTQPFPTKPLPFDRQGWTEDDLIDYTPELRARAKEKIEDFKMDRCSRRPCCPATSRVAAKVSSPCRAAGDRATGIPALSIPRPESTTPCPTRSRASAG